MVYELDREQREARHCGLRSGGGAQRARAERRRVGGGKRSGGTWEKVGLRAEKQLWANVRTDHSDHDAPVGDRW